MSDLRKCWIRVVVATEEHPKTKVGDVWQCWTSTDEKSDWFWASDRNGLANAPYNFPKAGRTHVSDLISAVEITEQEYLDAKAGIVRGGVIGDYGDAW